jgi:hypothetical protein
MHRVWKKPISEQRWHRWIDHNMALLGPNNSIAWAHFRLRGGWLRSLIFSAGATIVLWSVIFSLARFNPSDATRILAGWTTGLLGIEAAVMLLYATARIGTAVRQDITSKMIESHRVMPTGPLEATAGYISGAALQPLVLCGGFFLIGLWTCSSTGISLFHWMLVHVVLLGFAVFVWTIATYASFTARLGVALIFLPMFVGPMAADGGPLSAVPGLTVILNPLVGRSIFDMRNMGAMPYELPPTYAMALAAQFYFAAIFFIAASRRYRVADGVGVGTLLGLLLVLGWVAVSCVGLRAGEMYEPLSFRWMKTEAEVKVIASMIVGMLMALAAVAANAWSQRRWLLHRVLADPAPMIRPMPPALTIAIATLMILIIPFASSGISPPTAIQIAQSGIVIAIALAGVYFLCAWIYFGYDKAGILGLIWIFVTWGLPIVIDLIRFSLGQYGEVEQIDGIASCSPVGALIVIWQQRGVNVAPGIVMQASIAGVPFLLWLVVVLRRRENRLGYKATSSP